jgi:hypothetical protein
VKFFGDNIYICCCFLLHTQLRAMCIYHCINTYTRSTEVTELWRHEIQASDWLRVNLNYILPHFVRPNINWLYSCTCMYYKYEQQTPFWNASLQAKCPILAYSNLPLGIILTLSETSNWRALSFVCTLTDMFILSIVGLNGKPSLSLVPCYFA